MPRHLKRVDRAIFHVDLETDIGLIRVEGEVDMSKVGQHYPLNFVGEEIGKAMDAAAIEAKRKADGKA